MTKEYRISHDEIKEHDAIKAKRKALKIFDKLVVGLEYYLIFRGDEKGHKCVLESITKNGLMIFRDKNRLVHTVSYAELVTGEAKIR